MKISTARCNGFVRKKIAISISIYNSVIINIRGSAIVTVSIVSIRGMFIRGISARKVYAVNIVNAMASFGRLRIQISKKSEASKIVQPRWIYRSSNLRLSRLICNYRKSDGSSSEIVLHIRYVCIHWRTCLYLKMDCINKWRYRPERKCKSST